MSSYEYQQEYPSDLFVGIYDLINAIFTDFPGLVTGIINAVINIDETIGALSIAATFFTGGLDKVSKAGKLSKLGKLAEAEKPKSIPFNVMDTAKLKDYMKENVIKEAHRYKKQINDFVQSNLFKTIVNIKALSNQAADIFKKAKHVLNPEKINVLLNKTYEDVVKGPLVRTKMGMGRMVDGFFTKIGEVAETGHIRFPYTIGDAVENAKDTFVYAKDTIVEATESVGKVIGDVSGKIGTVIKGTDENIIQGARYGERKISDETYGKLRRASPSSKIQREVNKNIDDIIGTEDFALPGKIIDKKLHADHIVSLEKIARMKGLRH